MSVELENVIGRLDRAMRDAEAQRGQIDARWSSEEKRKREAEIAAALAERVEQLRKAGEQALVDGRREALARRYKAELAAGPKGDQWVEAQARAFFIAEDVQQLEPEALPEMYRAMRSAGDAVGSWLIAREGARYLDALRDDTDQKRVAAAVKALGELEELAGLDKIEARYKEEIGELNDLWRELVRRIPSAPVDRSRIHQF